MISFSTSAISYFIFSASLMGKLKGSIILSLFISARSNAMLFEIKSGLERLNQLL